MVEELLYWYIGKLVSFVFYIWAFFRSKSRGHKGWNTFILLLFTLSIIVIFWHIPFFEDLNETGLFTGDLILFFFPILYIFIDIIWMKWLSKKIKIVD